MPNMSDADFAKALGVSPDNAGDDMFRSEEHTSELQSH